MLGVIVMTKKRWPLIIVLVALILAVLFSMLLTKMRSVDESINVSMQIDIHDPELIKRGEYVASTADFVVAQTQSLQSVLLLSLW